MTCERSRYATPAAYCALSENYLGFPTGISGLELAGRAHAQAQKFGAQIMVAKGATGLACGRQPYALLTIYPGQALMCSKRR